MGLFGLRIPAHQSSDAIRQVCAGCVGASAGASIAPAAHPSSESGCRHLGHNTMEARVFGCDHHQAHGVLQHSLNFVASVRHRPHRKPVAANQRCKTHSRRVSVDGVRNVPRVPQMCALDRIAVLGTSVGFHQASISQTRYATHMNSTISDFAAANTPLTQLWARCRLINGTAHPPAKVGRCVMWWST